MMGEACRTDATLEEIQAGIKRRLETITELHAHAQEPDELFLPCAYPRLVDWTYQDTFDGATIWHFDVWVLVSLKPGFGRAQTHLWPYLSPTGRKSIKCAIDDDLTLGDTVSSARVTGGGVLGRVEIAGITALVASVRLEVFA